MKTQHNVKWQVSLSNGETLYEDKGEYIEKDDGSLSPWNKLLEYIKDNELAITSLSLYTDDNQHFSLPSLGKNPKFNLFAIAPKPTTYKMFRAYAQDVMGESSGQEDLFTVAEAFYGNVVMQIWVNERNPKNCWTLLLPVQTNPQKK